eukprot:5176584-Amphidinium_carterae.1
MSRAEVEQIWQEHCNIFENFRTTVKMAAKPVWGLSASAIESSDADGLFGDGAGSAAKRRKI